MDPQPLPQIPPLLQGHPDLVDAYSQCLLSEREAASPLECMYARCLGYFLLEMPGPGAQRMIADDINLCQGDQGKLKRLAKTYIYQVIKPFLRDKSSIPPPSSSKWYDRSDSPLADSPLPSDAVEGESRGPTAAKHAALERDDFSCMITAQPDVNTWAEWTPAERAARGTTTVTRTNFSQIAPPSRNWNRELDSDQVRHIDCCLLVIKSPPPAFTQARFPRTAWSLIHALGGIGDPEELHGNKGYRLSNALTLGIVVHTAFTDLDLWFEEDLVSAMPFS
ncbi:hypothetical protein MD484_g1564, partial [Candolleomyces efflorescens]